MDLTESFRNPKYEGLSLSELLKLDPRLGILTALGVQPSHLPDAAIQGYFEILGLDQKVTPVSEGATTSQT